MSDSLWALAAHAKKHNVSATARAIGCSEGSLRGILSKRSRPTPRLRADIETALKIPADGWGTRSRAKAIEKPTPTAASPEPVGSSLSELEALVQRIKRQSVEAEEDEHASVRDRAQLAAALQRALRDLAALRGDAQVSEAAVMRHPAFVRVLDVMRAALKAYPDAAAAVALAIANMRGVT